MSTFLLIAPYLLTIELIVIAGCLAIEWLDLLKEWSFEVIENNHFWIEVIKFEEQSK